MIEFDVPGRGTFQIEHLVLDVNGTLACDGQLLDGVALRIEALRQHVDICLLTADTHGKQHIVDTQLRTEATRITHEHGTSQKADYVRGLGAETVCAIGNGAIDAGMLGGAELAIAVVGPEGLAIEALQAADIVVGDINAALDLLIHPQRVVATLRK